MSEEIPHTDVRRIIMDMLEQDSAESTVTMTVPGAQVVFRIEITELRQADQA